MQRMAGAADVDPTGTDKDAVLQNGIASEVELAAVGDGAGGDGGAVQWQRGSAVGSKVGAGVGDAFTVQRVAACAGIHPTGLCERADLQSSGGGEGEVAAVYDIYP